MINIPKNGTYDIKYILLDYNGTIASSGKLLELPQLDSLKKEYQIYVLTGNTFGDAATSDLELIETKDAHAKLEFLESLGKDQCIAIGNGNIDHLMLKHAAISIAVIGSEGCSTKAILNADMVTTSIEDALSLIVEPKKLIAGLRG